jgi:hypothetical protein
MFTGISAGLIMGTYLLDSYYNYYNKKLPIEDNPSKKSQLNEQITQMQSYRNTAYYATIGSILLGFGLYAWEKYNEYGSEFDILTFILGKVQCDSLK